MQTIFSHHIGTKIISREGILIQQRKEFIRRRYFDRERRLSRGGIPIKTERRAYSGGDFLIRA